MTSPYEVVLLGLASQPVISESVVSVCTGAYGIAPTGLLDGRKVTTHWRFAEDFAARFPKLNVQVTCRSKARSLYDDVVVLFPSFR